MKTLLSHGIIYDEEVFYKVSDLILREFRKMSGECVSIGLVKITFPAGEIDTVELGGSNL